MKNSLLFKMVLGGLTIAALASCGGSKKKSKKVSPVDAPVTVQDPIDQDPIVLDPLIGSWKSMCRGSESGNAFIHSIYSFNEDQSLNIKSLGFKDRRCTQRFSAEEIERSRQNLYNFLIMVGSSEEEATIFAHLSVAPLTEEGLNSDGTYLIGNTLADGTIELDTEHHFDGATIENYNVYKLEGDQLFMSESCNKIDDEIGCSEISGDSPESRELSRNLDLSPMQRIAN